MVEKINDIFEKIYVISYDESPKLDTLSDRLKGLNYEIFYGCNKKDVNVKDLLEKGYDGRRYGNYNMTEPASFACTLSHLSLYQKLKKENLNNVLILEDDVIIVKDAIQNMIDSYNNLPENWDVFYLGFSNTSKNWNNVLSKNYKDIMYKGKKLHMNEGVLPLEGTNAFAINNNFLDLAIEKQTNPETMHPIADGLMFYLYYSLEYFACIPQVFPQIDNKNNFYKK